MKTIKLFEGLGKNFVTEIKLENGVIEFPFSISQPGYFSKEQETLSTDCLGDYTFFAEDGEELIVCGYLSHLTTTSLKIRPEAVGHNQFIVLSNTVGRMLIHPFNDSHTNNKEYFRNSLLRKISEIEEAIPQNLIPHNFVKYAENLISKMKNQLKEVM